MTEIQISVMKELGSTYLKVSQMISSKPFRYDGLFVRRVCTPQFHTFLWPLLYETLRYAILGILMHPTA